MSLDKALKNLQYDVRMVEFNLNHGVVSKEDMKKQLNQLPDLASNCEQINLEEASRSSSSDISQH